MLVMGHQMHVTIWCCRFLEIFKCLVSCISPVAAHAQNAAIESSGGVFISNVAACDLLLLVLRHYKRLAANAVAASAISSPNSQLPNGYVHKQTTPFRSLLAAS